MDTTALSIKISALDKSVRKLSASLILKGELFGFFDTAFHDLGDYISWKKHANLSLDYQYYHQTPLAQFPGNVMLILL